jgi:hypothetical protein
MGSPPEPWFWNPEYPDIAATDGVVTQSTAARQPLEPIVAGREAWSKTYVGLTMTTRPDATHRANPPSRQ